MVDPGDFTIKSTALSFDIIQYVQEANGATLSEIVDEYQKPKSTLHGHLSTLEELGYLTREGQTYHVSIRFLNLGGKARSRSDLYSVAEDEVRNLAFETGEHANLMVEYNGLGIFLIKQKGPDSVRLDTYEGMEVHLHTTAMGKAILAEMSDGKREQIIDEHGLPAVTENTITDRAELESELDDIRERGYATDNEERVQGIRCVATSITTDDEVVGAVSISAPRSRMSGDRFTDEFPSKIQSTANIIEVNLQHG